MKHVLVFIHGMGDDAPVERFEQLWDLIEKHYDKGNQGQPFCERYAKCFVDWHAVTLDVQTRTFSDAFAPLTQPVGCWQTLRHPIAAARRFFTHYLGDVVAYVDEADNGIRREVWTQMAATEGFLGCRKFSIVAHSLGSVIAFDFLYHLLIEEEIFDTGTAERPLTKEERVAFAAPLKDRFVGFYTMGSPVALFMQRNRHLWTFENIKNPIPKEGVWKNFWDCKDVVAYPAKKIFSYHPEHKSRPLDDVKVCTGFGPVSAHVGYWKCNAVAKAIAKSLRESDPAPGLPA